MMTRKILLMVLALIFIFQVASAKDKTVALSLEERVKIFVEVADTTNFVELDTSSRLRGMLTEKLTAQNIFNVIDENGVTYSAINHSENIFDAKTLGDKKTLADVGELLIFPPPADEPFSEDDKTFYEKLGVEYIVRCKILGLGVEQQVESYGYGPSIGIGVGIGSRRHSRFGIGVGTDIPINSTRKRNVYNVAVQLQFVNAETGTTLWRSNFIGQAVKHNKPSKGYDDAGDEAYLQALQNLTKDIVKRVTEHSQKFLIDKTEQR